MLIAAIITGIIALASGVIAIVRDFSSNGDNGFWPFVTFVVFGFLWLIAFLVSLNVSIGSHSLTGYIYSDTSQFGYTTAHIRYSQNAGMDVQPEFCVKTDSKAGQQILADVGTGTKVKINIPSYFYFAESPFACGTTKMTITTIN